MEVFFRTTKMQKFSEDHKKLGKKHGVIQAEKIIKRINELKASESLYDISRMPQTGLHPLSGDLEGKFAVYIQQPYRMIFKPLNGEISELRTITKIEIVEIYCDYH